MEKENKNKFIEMMDLAVKCQLFKTIDESLKSINENFDKVGDWKSLPIETVKDLADAFENVSNILEKIVHKEEV